MANCVSVSSWKQQLHPQMTQIYTDFQVADED